MTDDQINDLWIRRDCMAAIQAGDILAQVRCVVRAALSTLLAEHDASLSAERARGDRLEAELRNITSAKRFDKEHFAGDMEFADWVVSRANHAINQTPGA